jgi:hypothetical protein
MALKAIGAALDFSARARPAERPPGRQGAAQARVEVARQRGRRRPAPRLWTWSFARLRRSGAATI